MAVGKNFFFVIAGIGLLVLSAEKIYQFWQLRCNERMAHELAIATRRKMDQFYIGDFELAFRIYLSGEKKMLQDAQLNNTIKNIENNMIQDGYNHAEAGLIKKQAIERINAIQ